MPKEGTMNIKTLIYAFVLVLVSAPFAAAQADTPLVAMSVTSSDGHAQDLSARESGLATLSVNGTEYGFRPTIQDSKPWNQIVVTIFKMATSSAPTSVLGEVDVKRAGAAVTSKTTPSFKVAVRSVSAPAASTH
jgi:hypothetical protein